MRAKILISLMFVSMLVPAVSMAASTDIAPEFNPMCWHKKDCDEARASILNKKASEVKSDKGGWLNEEPCNTEGWGLCLPAGVTVTEVAFGGKKEFSNIGDFLKTNFNLAMTFAGILAVIMIIIAGVQWVSSGGNSEMITSAKKRIGGALTGLLIAYLSYTILNTINPAMVNLRLPQTFMLRPFKVMPEMCRDAEAKDFMLAAEKGVTLDSNKITELLKTPKFDQTEKEKFGCGNKYFASGGGQSTCMGGYCKENGQSCLPVTIQGEDTVISGPNCQPGQLIIHYSIALSLMDYVLENVPLGKKMEDKDWLSWFGTKDFFTSGFTFWPVCKAKTTGQLYIGGTSEQWDSNDVEGRKIATIKKNPYYEYYVVFDKLNPYTNPPGSARNADFWKCFSPDDTIDGFVFNSVLAQNWGRDADFYISTNRVGSWKSIKENGYISVDQLKKGNLINVVVDSGVLSDIFDNPTSAPYKFHVDGAKNGDEITASGPVSQEQITKEVNKELFKAKMEAKSGI